MNQRNVPGDTRPRLLRLVVHDFGGYPFILQLSSALAQRGYEVLHVVADGFRTPKIAIGDDRVPHLHIEAVTLREPMRGGGFARYRQEARYARLVAERVSAFHPDAVISANSPLTVQQALLRVSGASRGAFVFWLQDLHSVAIGRLLGRRLGVAGGLIGKVFGRMERRLLRNSDAVVPISTDFLPVLKAWGVDGDLITVRENWAPIDHPLPGDDSPSWAAEHDLVAGPLIVYSGTLALKHNPALLVDLARGLPDALVAVVAEGSGAEWLRSNAQGVTNLRLLPLQPYEDVARMLASADLLVAVLEADASAFSAPSKVLTYIAAGRPVLAAMPKDNPMAKLLLRTGAGWVIEPDDPSALVRAAAELLGRPATLNAAAKAAVAYASAAFEIESITDEFETILVRAMDRKSHSGEQRQSDTGARPHPWHEVED
jgi:putative colanic acid biosynthesis glycosyltransferase WcaI